MRREPPRGPKALIDSPGPPRGGGGFGGDFRGGRGRGRGRGWARDDSRERGRDRDIDYRDRYRDERSRERDRDRDRDWRNERDFRPRRSPPISRPRSPLRDFRDRERERDLPPPVDIERPRRGSRDGGPPSAGSSNSDPAFGMPPFSRGGGYVRGRGRGGRGDWQSDRARGRTPYDDRDRYARSRSQEGRWGRDRDERDRHERYAEPDIRRDPRDERERNDRELFRQRQDSRSIAVSESAPQSREVSPPPIAPIAPAFGTVPNRGSISTDDKAPVPTTRGFGERPASSGAPNESLTATGSSRVVSSELSAGSKASLQYQQQRIYSQQGTHLSGRKASEISPLSGRMQNDMSNPDLKRPRSSDANSETLSGPTSEKRARSPYSAEPGEITVRTDNEQDSSAETETTKQGKHSRQNLPVVRAVRFSLPPKGQAAGSDSDSDDDDDMADYFASQMEKTQAELDKLQADNLPQQVLARFAAMSHGAMVQVLYNKEGLSEMLGKLPEGVAAAAAAELPVKQSDAVVPLVVQQDLPASEPTTEQPSVELVENLEEQKVVIEPAQPLIDNSDIKSDKMDVDRAVVTQEELERPKSSSKESIKSDGGGVKEQIIEETENMTTLDMRQDLIEKADTGSKVPSTPSQVEDDDDTESEDDTYIDIDAVRQYMKTPELDTMPDYNIQQPWDKDGKFIASLDMDPTIDDYVVQHLDKMRLDQAQEEDTARQDYADNYLRYLDFTASNDPIALKNRDKFSTSVPPVDIVEAAETPEPAKPEGRSARRFASERDLERVLQASMREDEERKERQLRIQKEKYRSEKEAVIPDMYWDAEDRIAVQYDDRTGYVPQDRLVAAWEVLAPFNNFTEEETELFEKRYLEHPKQWGKVAEIIPDRSFGTCIQYYYLMKKDLNLKDKLRKQPKKRKKGGRGKQRSSALVSELGNGDPETEENQEGGENGERRRPRRAAAPTWGFEQPAQVDTDNSTPVSTPGRRGVRGDQGEKVDGRRGRRRAKDKDAKTLKPNQNLAAAPAQSAKGRPRSASRNPPSDFPPNQQTDMQPMTQQFEPQMPSSIQPPFSVQPHPHPMHAMDRQKPSHSPHPPPHQSHQSHPSHPPHQPSLSEVMAPPSLRPEPTAPNQVSMPTFNLGQDRKAPTQASSYWSVSESNDFPHLLRAFGSDWTAIAAHMGSKTAVMVSELMPADFFHFIFFHHKN